MQNFKLIKSISLIICAFLITSCSKNSAMKPEDFKNKEPRLIIEDYLLGNVKAGAYYKIDQVKLLGNFLQI